jgi:uncharacterized protein YutE (UPF0331/DUF86 family)
MRSGGGMVDPQRLSRVLTRVRQDLAVLRRYADHDRAELLGDDARMGHVKYLFVTLVEGCIDAAQHICASDGLGPPDTNADAMLVLARNGLLPAELAATMADAVRFRNVLVHLYAEVDDTRVADNLSLLDEVERFVAALTALLEPADG